jgi:signal transduction histidine kinase
VNSQKTQDYNSDNDHTSNYETTDKSQKQSSLSTDLDLAGDYGKNQILEGDFFHSIYQSTAAAIYVVEVLPGDQYRYLAFNPTCEQCFGPETEKLVGKSPLEVFSAADGQAIIQNYTNCVRSQETSSYEECLLVGNVRSSWITTLAPQKDTAGNIYRLIGTSFNINQRQQIREEVLVQANRERLLSSITQRIGQSLDLDTILQRTVEEVRSFLQTDRVLIYRFDAHWRGFMEVESVIAPWKSVLGLDIQDSCLTTNYVEYYRQGRIQVVGNIDSSGLHPCYIKLLASFEVKANLIVPIVAEQELWGLLIAQHCRSPREWLRADIELLKQLATKVGIAVQQAELHQQVRHLNVRLEAQVEERTSQLCQALQQLKQALKSEELIRSITEAIRDSIDEKQILQAATQNLAKGLNIECCQIELYKSQHTITEVVYEYPFISPASQGIIRQVANLSELYNQLLLRQPLHFVDLFPSVGYRKQQVTRLACPIFDDRGILGNLWLLRPKEEIFKFWEIQLVQQVANQCAIAIRQARLYKVAQLQVQELEKLNLVKDDFLKTISHELRTPMSSIRLAVGTLETLLEKEIGAQKSARFNKVLSIFRSSCQRQNQLVDDLLTLCYLDIGSQPIVWEPIELKAWISKIVSSYLVRITHQHQQLKLDFVDDLPLLQSEPEMLKRIVKELLNNACKYTPVGETIAIQVEKTTTTIRLSISNSGVEIPPEEQERIFDKFYRIPNHDPWKYGGTGIGLALVKKLVELLKAEIVVNSKEKITTFTISFPLLP